MFTLNLFGLKIQIVKKIFGRNESHFFQKSRQTRILETCIRHKNSEKGSPTFSSKIQEKVDVETRKWHIPVRKYQGLPPIGHFLCYLTSIELWIPKSRVTSYDFRVSI